MLFCNIVLNVVKLCQTKFDPFQRWVRNLKWIACAQVPAQGIVLIQQTQHQQLVSRKIHENYPVCDDCACPLTEVFQVFNSNLPFLQSITMLYHPFKDANMVQINSVTLLCKEWNFSQSQIISSFAW